MDPITSTERRRNNCVRFLHMDEIAGGRKKKENLHFPIVGGAGIPAKCTPSGVKRNSFFPILSNAPSFSRLVAAEFTDVTTGGSSSFFRNLPLPSSTPRKRSESNVWSRAQRLISGAVCSSSLE
jgi:hypothetical protein